MRHLLTALLVLTIASTATAQTWGEQQHPSNERGFRADQLYQFNGFDDVNLFNGNLILTLPLGINYTVDSVLSYQFVLRYSGNVWHEHEFCSDIHDGCHLNYTLHTGDNAGVGWRLSFGELRAPIDPSATATASGMWMYRSPDGSEHLFFATIHDCVQPGTPECESPVANLLYTRDGTYLRLRILDSTSVVIDFPTGEHQRYIVDGTTWRLEYMYDAFASLNANNQPTTNYVKFDPVPNAVGTNDLHVTDAQGRNHYIRFTADGKIDKLELAAFNSEAGIYDLAYDQYVLNSDGTTNDGTAETIAKPCYNSQSSTASAAVRLLTRVATATGQAYVFSYNKGDMSACTGGSDLSANDVSGTIQGATLPTGGRVEWQYRNYSFATSDSFDHAIGVYQRNAYDGTTQTQQQQYAGGANGTSVITKFVPVANSWQPQIQTTYYFQNQLLLDGLYGLPFTTAAMTSPSNPDGSSTTRYLSSQTVECTPTTGSCASTASRAKYVKYELDAVQSLCDPPSPCNRDRNRRVVSERTSYLDDSGRYVDVDHAAFDGLGHYRSTTKSGTMTSGTRVTYTNYNPLAGIYNANGTGGFNSQTIPSTWLLNAYDSRAVSDGTRTAAQGFCFNATTGFLENQWTYKTDASLAGGAPLITRAAGDLLAHFDQVGGNVTTEKDFGGDIQDASQWTLCSVPTESPRYQLDRTYTFGSLATEQYTGASFYTANNANDSNTGLVAASTDSAGVSTSYKYDLDGRLVAAQPIGSAWTAYRYWRPGEQATGAPASVDITDCANGTNGCAPGDTTFLRQQRVEFDAFGRVAREKRLVDGAFNIRETKYDALGRKIWTSEAEADNGTSPTHGTTFTYDAFDRPLTIKPADGDLYPNHIITSAYTGDRVVSRTEHVATTLADEAAETTTKTYDDEQRLLTVAEPNGTTTAYTYDVTGHLATVEMTSGGTMQPRTFTYDNRGFLNTEQHPENGLTTYGGYDARGHVGFRLVTDPGSQCNYQTYRCFDLQYAYDNAERVQSVQSRNPLDPANFRPFKEFTYDTSNDSPGRSNGKLTVATRHNYDPTLGETIVTESYGYNDGAGHLTDKTTVVGPNGTLSKTFKQHYDFDNLGSVFNVTYPWCADAAGCGYGTAWQSITQQYTNSDLTSITLPSWKWPEPANTLSYWPSGMLHTVNHGNSVTDTYVIDPATEMARPSTISFGNWSTCAPPRIDGQPVSSTIDYNSQQTLTVTAAGNGISYQWYCGSPGDTGVPVNGETGSQFLTPQLTQTMSYWVLVSNACGHINSTGVTVSVQLLKPNGFTATRIGTTSAIALSWQSSPGATSYSIYRRSGSAFVPVGTSTSTTFQDGGGLEAVYVYQVSASGPSVLTSPASSNDIANTLTLTPPNPDDAVSFAQFDQLRTEVNAVRAAWGDPAFSWSDILNANVNYPCAYGTVATTPSPDAIVYAAHMMRLRCAMDNALTRAGITPWSYIDPDLTDQIIGAVHVSDLQQRPR